ncbi:hypothetical protein [Myceligenerans crystallogenes]|uniref:Uncharacterized protein n=1 Tax=Myceligenerans crystallogenes TaxID=316335 RepID=A0ABP4ZEQ8_9MICO
MHVRLMAPFMVPKVLDRIWREDGSMRVERDSLIGRLLADLGATMNMPVESDLVIEDHKPGAGAGLVSRRALARVAVREHEASLHLSALGIATLTLDVEVAGLEELRSLETRLRGDVDRIAGETVAVVRRHLGTDAGAAFEGQIIWWHRLLVAPAPEVCAVHGLTHGGDRVEVGDGYTYVPDGAFLDDVEEGVLAATEEWIIFDGAYRGMLDQMGRMRNASRRRRTDRLDELVLEGAEAAADLEYQMLVMDERARYLTHAAAATRASAVAAWRLDESREGLRDQVTSVRSVASDARDAIGRKMDVRRNNLLYLFTLIAAMEMALIVYEFLVERDAPITSILRVVVAGAMLIAAGASTYLVMTGERRG